MYRMFKVMALNECVCVREDIFYLPVPLFPTLGEDSQNERDSHNLA